jgi:dTDP-4-dehydrorhamnose 3,5-epimerase
MANVYQLGKFSDARGWSLNDIYAICDLPSNGQINYSILYPGIVKAWHRHQYQDDYFCVLKGMAQVGVVGDDGTIQKFFIGEHNPAVVHIKAGEWHGLTALGNEPVGLLYLVTRAYNPIAPDEERAPYDKWVGREWWLPENK